MNISLTYVYHSRSSIKKYVLANNTDLPANQATFDNLLNKAIKSGVEKGDFEQPKGRSSVLNTTRGPCLLLLPVHVVLGVNSFP